MAKRVLAGRYEIEAALGEGGMAKVFRGRDRVLGRTVAIKVLAPQFAEDQQFVARFRREAQAAAALNHPNIVSVFDTGSTANVHYIVMEYVEGRTLRDVLREEGRLRPGQAIEITEAVCRALEAAHAKGVVHRDIKPANIMLTPGGQVKVMDFGIARATSADTVTQTAAVLGTAAYLSPEQAQGERVDARSDIYSLGCVLYEMLTGAPPFTGESPVTVAYKHVNEDPTRPGELNPDLTPELEAVVMKAMAKNRENRYASAGEMAEDLRRVSQGAPVTAPPVMTGGEATQVISRAEETALLEAEPYEEEPPGRNPWAIVLVTLLVIAVLGTLGFFLARALVGEGATEPVTVPDVVGFEEQAAVQTLEQEGFEVEVERRFRANPPRGIVFRQDPEAGQEVEEGSVVTIFVSRGPRRVEVPDVVGLPEEEARAAIEGAKLTVGTVVAQPSEEEPGTVLAQDPPAGEEVDEGTPVNLIVSGGPATVEVPDVVCQPLDQARDEIEAAMLLFEDAGDEFSDACPAGTVARQAPQPGVQVAPETTVMVWESLGPSPTPPPPTSPSPVPTDL